MEYDAFRKNIKNLYDASGKNMKDFASDIGLTPSAISRYISGKRMPELSCVMMIAKHFEISLDWLLGLNEEAFAYIPKDAQNIMSRYFVACDDDKTAIRAILKKYEKIL